VLIQDRKLADSNMMFGTPCVVTAICRNGSLTSSASVFTSGFSDVAASDRTMVVSDGNVLDFCLNELTDVSSVVAWRGDALPVRQASARTPRSHLASCDDETGVPTRRSTAGRRLERVGVHASTLKQPRDQ
jgi:hypothetical protein